jgi:hypothetical protein
MTRLKRVTTVFSVFLLMMISCEKDVDVEPISNKEFGLEGTHNVSTFTSLDYSYTTVYYPSDIAIMPEKSPLVFFISGWFGTPQTSAKYETLLRFLAKHGYTVIYTDEGSTTNFQVALDSFDNMLANQEVGFKNNVLPYIDTSRIGVIGHSAGGGTTLTTLKYYSSPDKNYGENGRFVMGLDPWYAFGMTENDIKTLPTNTNLVFIKFGVGGNSNNDGTDARIPLTIYSLLESIANSKKDYQIYDQENANHSYPQGNRSYTEMQGILKPLDALLDYTFVEQSERTRLVALENGNDDPYANGQGIQVVLDAYDYPCDGADTEIDYCAIVD